MNGEATGPSSGRRRPPLFLATESLTPGNGGIARVARLIALVLDEESRAGRIRADALALSDRNPPDDLTLSTSLARGSRMRFVVEVHHAALRHGWFIYDSLGMSRAHCRVRPFRRPYLVFIHGIEVWEDIRTDRLKCARRADVLVANSSYTRARAEALHGVFGRASVCWLATESDHRPTARRRDLRPRILVCGRVEEGYKGHAELLEAWPTIAEAVPDARLTFVGRNTESFREAAQRTKYGDRIDIRGFLPERDLEHAFADADVFSMPSRGEGFGLVYVEAMRHGLPVVASVHDAASEINLDGETGYNVNLDRRAELADRLVHLLRNRDAARRLGEAAQRRWSREFRFSAFRERFLPLLDALMSR